MSEIPNIVHHGGGLTRRAFAIGGAAAAVAAYAGVDWFSAQPAQAAIAWNQPFTFAAPVSGTFDYYNPEFYGAPPHRHHALDLAPARGTPIYAVAAGTVVARAVESQGVWYGNHVMISHGEGFWTSYSHMELPPSVELNQSIAAATLIGFVGGSGSPST